MSHSDIVLGVIGGTGIYQLAGSHGIESLSPSTSYGETSAPIRIVEIAGRRLAFLARHGEAHGIAPHAINYRANIAAFKALGIHRVLGINTVGGITAAMAPRSLALPDQLIDYTHGRDSTFGALEGGMVQHIEFADPYSSALRAAVVEAARASATSLIDAGCYGATQGPRLETRAEIARLKRDGCDLVGMTGMPEAALAREAGIDYASLCIVANWAAGCDVVDRPITMDEVMGNVAAATGDALAVIARMV